MLIIFGGYIFLYLSPNNHNFRYQNEIKPLVPRTSNLQDSTLIGYLCGSQFFLPWNSTNELGLFYYNSLVIIELWH